MTRFLLRFGRRFCFSCFFLCFYRFFLIRLFCRFLIVRIFRLFCYGFLFFPCLFRLGFFLFSSILFRIRFLLRSCILRVRFRNLLIGGLCLLFCLYLCLHSGILIRCYISADPQCCDQTDSPTNLDLSFVFFPHFFHSSSLLFYTFLILVYHLCKVLSRLLYVTLGYPASALKPFFHPQILKNTDLSGCRLYF